ncbi:MAG: lytic transglycosylase domain-containing protein [Verrucomicrobiota bacterium]
MMKQLRLLVSVLVVPLLLALACLTWWWLEDSRSNQNRYDSLIKQASIRYQVPPSLIRAVIWRESRFDPKAYGQADERGLMQVRVPAASEWVKAENIKGFQPDDLYDPQTNILAGTWYLARATSRWKDMDTPYIFGLAEYNAGRVHARRWAKDLENPDADSFIQAIDFPTTKKYILDIQERYLFYLNQPKPTFWEHSRELIEYYWTIWTSKR